MALWRAQFLPHLTAAAQCLAVIAPYETQAIEVWKPRTSQNAALGRARNLHQ
jgi:hypothetical protein